ncbi:MAG: hypothetical protein ACOY9Y_09870 [Bacillota bacterium]
MTNNVASLIGFSAIGGGPSGAKQTCQYDEFSATGGSHGGVRWTYHHISQFRHWRLPFFKGTGKPTVAAV